MVLCGQSLEMEENLGFWVIWFRSQTQASESKTPTQKHRFALDVTHGRCIEDG